MFVLGLILSWHASSGPQFAVKRNCVICAVTDNVIGHHLQITEGDCSVYNRLRDILLIQMLPMFGVVDMETCKVVKTHKTLRKWIPLIIQLILLCIPPCQELPDPCPKWGFISADVHLKWSANKVVVTIATDRYFVK